MKNKLLGMLLITLAISLMGITALCAEVIDSGTCGEDLIWELDSEFTLTISGNGAMYNYEYYDEDYDEDSPVEPGYPEDDEYPEYPEDEEVVLNEYAYTYGPAPWSEHHKNILNVVINKGVTSIGNYAFFRCTNMTNATIPSSVISIGEGAFGICNSIANITIPNGVINIDYGAFAENASLTSITIPSSVTSVGRAAFSGCISLTSINVDANNANYISVDGVLFNESQTKLFTYPAGKSATDYLIPDSVTNIDNHAFYYCRNLANITIPDSVTSIGDCAFASCFSLTSITIPESVTSFGCSAFDGCISLTSVTLPDSITYISLYAFAGCNNLTTVYYEGSKEEWEKIIIDYGNECLENANVIFNAVTVSRTKTTLTESADGKYTYTVNATNVPVGSSILFVCYDGDKLVYMDMKEYTGTMPTYSVDSKTVDYDTIKVFVWENTKSMNQLCNAEIVSL